jgi:hypothetical protein
MSKKLSQKRKIHLESTATKSVNKKVKRKNYAVLRKRQVA